jgi:hypothetical protein
VHAVDSNTTNDDGDRIYGFVGLLSSQIIYCTVFILFYLLSCSFTSALIYLLMRPGYYSALPRPRELGHVEVHVLLSARFDSLFKRQHSTFLACLPGLSTTTMAGQCSCSSACTWQSTDRDRRPPRPAVGGMHGFHSKR